MRALYFIASSLACTMLATPASAVDVRLLGNITNSCVLTLTTPGRLAASTDGTILGTEQLTGAPAIMAVVALGGGPTIQFTAPALTAPSGYSGGTPAEMKINSLLGINIDYTSSAQSPTITGLLDTITVHGRVQNATGFRAGNYEIKTVATCQQ